MESRLKHYEALLQERGIDPHQDAAPTQQDQSQGSTTTRTPSASASVEQQQEAFKTHILKKQNSTKLVDNSLWSRVAEEIEETEDVLEDSGNDSEDDVGSDDDFTFVLGHCGSQSPGVPLHPSPEQVRELWRIYTSNVDPITKLVHIPSLHVAMEKAIMNLEQVPRGFEALMFAIYSMAVLSLTADECLNRIGEHRVILLRRYVQATKAALLRAKFMSSNSLVVLQALVLHIFSTRDSSEPRAVWRLTGIAFRVAEGMGIRIDGTLLGLSPFETEMRRRVWWQLKMHDFRAAELCGQSKMKNFDLGEDNPRIPLNVDDRDLYPSMTEDPIESSKPTEMIWVMMRTSLAAFASKLKIRMCQLGNNSSFQELTALDNIEEKDGWVEEMQTMLETNIIRYCDPTKPLHLWTMIGCRLSVNLSRFLGHHPRKWASLEHVPESEKQLVWETVMSLLEQYEMMQTSPQLRNFAWNIPYFTQWHAIIHALDTLRAQPLHPDAEKVWEYILHLYERMSDVLFKVNRPIFVAVGNLCLKAFSAREAALQTIGRSIPPPDYIKQLREQREAARARKQNENSRRNGQAENLGVTTMNPDYQAAQASLPPPLYPQIQQSSGPAPAPNMRTKDDAFWLSDALGNDAAMNGVPDVTTLDMDFVLSQDMTNNVVNEPIDWGQWDAWFGRIEPLRVI
jgi:hypothetical protein